MNDLIGASKSALATQDELLAIVVDEATRALLIQDADGEARKQLASRLKDSERELAAVKKKLAVANKARNGPNLIQNLWQKRLSVPRFLVCALLSVGALVGSAAIVFPLVAPSVTSAIGKALEALQVNPDDFAFVGRAVGMAGLSMMALAILSSRFQWWLYLVSLSTGVVAACCGLVIASQRYGGTGYLRASGVTSAMAALVLGWAYKKVRLVSDEGVLLVLALVSGAVCFALLALVGWFCGVIG